ncbi:MAG: D-aminoacyl-tRNA deacylase [Acidobacteriota bacterium]
MRAVLQRVRNSSVEVGGEIVGKIDRGLLVLVAAERGDGPAEVQAMADKLSVLRIFSDAEGKMNLDIREAGGAFLIVSQFTLGASLRKGRRPSFNESAPPQEAEPLVEALIEALKIRDFEVATGRFGADMQVELINDGPVTFVLEVRDGRVL